MERVILHVDANSYYASVECLYTPSIRHKPVAVSGDAEARHGIILTKNQIAKQYGVQTGEAIWQGRCDHLRGAGRGQAVCGRGAQLQKSVPLI